ncbi:MAG: RsmE family RNA methyltransferase [Myxococcota bacterium]|nr:RsmE family RNA methyltransferase [Myxococcota bacterium]
MTLAPPKKRRRLLLPELSPGERLLSQEASHYLMTVLRLKVGETLELFDGAGTSADGQLLKAEKKLARINISELRQHLPTSPALTAAVAPPKGERAELIIEKLCELGVARIVWLQSERSVTLPSQTKQRHQRKERIAQAAASQSGRFFVPSIEGPLSLEAFLEEKFDKQYLAHFAPGFLHDELPGLAGANTLSLIIGPEGGFTDNELRQIQDAGYLPRRLGHHTLRSETAAIAGVALLMRAEKQP